MRRERERKIHRERRGRGRDRQTDRQRRYGIFSDREGVAVKREMGYTERE